MKSQSVNTITASRRKYLMWIFCWLGSLLLLPSSVFAIDIEEAIWGFGNQQTKGKCIPLSLLLSNNTPDVFDELVQLNRLQYNGNKVGAPLCRKVFLAPYSSQWVQFYPYIIDEGQTEWSLNWGPRFFYSRKFTKNGKSYDNNQNDGDQRSRILLSNSTALAQSGSHFKQYPEELFPPAVTATDSLDEVVLNHVPRWDTARKTSFMDWLYRGGTLHLLSDSSGTNLNFTANMVELNTPQDHFRVGSGLVIRHPEKVTKLTPELLISRMQKIRAEELAAMTVPTSPGENKQPATQQNNDSYYYGDSNVSLLHAISEMTRPEHNWAIIYLMTVLYIIIIFPGCFLFNKKQKHYHYRNSLFFLLITVALFSTVFWGVGKRGYGETTAINSLIVAQPLQNDQYDLTCWNNAFVTDGAEYQFSSTGDGILFTTAQEAEQVRGAIFNGVDGIFYSDIPPFSARSFMYRIKASYKEPDIKILDYQIDPDLNLSSLKLEFNAGLIKGPFTAQVLYGRNLCDLQQTQEDGRSVWNLTQARKPLSAWQTLLESDLTNSRRYGYEDEKNTRQIYELLYGRLVLNHLNLLRPSQLSQYQGDKARIKLFLYCDIPDELKLKTNVQGVQQGRVLFAYDLPLPEKKNDKKNE